MRWIDLLAVAVLAFVGGCGSNSSGPISDVLKTPSDVHITPPAPGLAPELAAFSGIWEGKWDGKIPSKLIVESIDASSAHIVFLHKASRARSLRVTATVLAGGKIQFGGDSRPRITFTMSKDHVTIDGTYEPPKGTASTVIMTKVSS